MGRVTPRKPGGGEVSKLTTYTCDFCGRSSSITDITNRIDLKITIGGWVSSVLEQQDICSRCSRLLTSPSPYGHAELKNKLKKEFMDYFNTRVLNKDFINHPEESGNDE